MLSRYVFHFHLHKLQWDNSMTWGSLSKYVKNLARGFFSNNKPALGGHYSYKSVPKYVYNVWVRIDIQEVNFNGYENDNVLSASLFIGNYHSLALPWLNSCDVLYPVLWSIGFTHICRTKGFSSQDLLLLLIASTVEGYINGGLRKEMKISNGWNIWRITCYKDPYHDSLQVIQGD